MRPVAPIATLAGLSGCAAQGAPSFILFGAYFPAWMFCAVIGIAGALAARITMVATGLSETVPLQLFVCASIGLIVAVSAWLLWFGR
jgi:hypothetical protein